jgi:hypothetical protein
MRKLLCLLLGLLFLVVLGCSPSVGTVNGTVSYKGTMLKGGTVTFLAPDGKAASCEIKEDGHYTVDKVPTGPVKISVETKSLAVSARAPSYSPPPGVTPPGGYKPPDRAEKAKRYVPIPETYSDPEKSGLSYTVKPGMQDYNITLQ